MPNEKKKSNRRMQLESMSAGKPVLTPVPQVQVVVAEDPLFSCNVCHSVFKTESGLTRHVGSARCQQNAKKFAKSPAGIAELLNQAVLLARAKYAEMQAEDRIRRELEAEAAVFYSQVLEETVQLAEMREGWEEFKSSPEFQSVSGQLPAMLEEILKGINDLAEQIEKEMEDPRFLLGKAGWERSERLQRLPEIQKEVDELNRRALDEVFAYRMEVLHNRNLLVDLLNGDVVLPLSKKMQEKSGRKFEALVWNATSRFHQMVKLYPELRDGQELTWEILQDILATNENRLFLTSQLMEQSVGPYIKFVPTRTFDTKKYSLDGDANVISVHKAIEVEGFEYDEALETFHVWMTDVLKARYQVAGTPALKAYKRWMGYGEDHEPPQAVLAKDRNVVITTDDRIAELRRIGTTMANAQADALLRQQEQDNPYGKEPLAR